MPSRSAAFFLSLVLVTGCGRIPEAEEAGAPTPPAPPPVTAQPSPHMQFETRTDTVSTEKTRHKPGAQSTNREPQIRYMVQVGAFKVPNNASRVQTIARARYHLPVLNDYNTAYSLYQIRIGFFESREDAYKFRQRMQQEHPADYKDAWVVQLKR